MILDEVDVESRELLARYDFDADAFDALRARLTSGELTIGGNVVIGTVEPPAPEDLTVLPAPGAPSFASAFEVGVDALRQGTIACVVLAGGMATRFGGGVKGIVEVIDGRSFLDVKLGETRRLAEALDAEIPCALMTSFATDTAVRAHVRERRLGEPRIFSQTAAPRLRPDGSLFVGADGKTSLYGPGHGDVLHSIRSSGTLDELVAAGVRSVVVSNVDNLGARLDPAIIGMHLLAGRPLTVEVVEKAGDVGGAPARVDGRPMLLESFRFPSSFDQSRIPVFNTNTALITVEALARPVELTWLVAEKQVEGERVLQFERLYHELAAFVPTTFLVVPRHGPRGRFIPVKEPADLAAVQPLLRQILAASPLEA